jgi:dUTP pyrophosphatase
MVIARYERVTWESTTQLNQTERSEGGFGHTGIKEKR